MTVKDYRQLVVWQRAMDLVEMVYRTTASFPKGELYGLTSQIRRAVISIPSNIAERLAYLDGRNRSELIELTTEVGRLMSGLRNSLKRRITQNR